MKYLKIVLLFIIAGHFNVGLLSQNSYIQVQGEANLKVYLNGTFKGVTKQDIGGYVIENVRQGKNKIKIEKEGYAPYEEEITVKSGEVLLYKVKPFIKHSVVISESGNTEVTDKQAELKTGKIIIQSVPIEIKISIPSIEGVENVTKKKDLWTAESVPVGSYKVKLSFNGKELEKTITVDENETTKIFANLLNSEITVSGTKKEKEDKANELDKYFKDMAPKIDAFDYSENIKIGKTVVDLEKNNFKVKANKHLDNPNNGQEIIYSGKTIGYCDINPQTKSISGYFVYISKDEYDNFLNTMKNYSNKKTLQVYYSFNENDGGLLENYTFTSNYNKYIIYVMKYSFKNDNGTIFSTYFTFNKYPKDNEHRVSGTLKEF